jgi:phosphoserine phosphatase
VTVLHVFDMDGTLLRGTSASLEIARDMNRVPDLLELEQSFAAGGLSTYDFAVAAFDLYRGLDRAGVAGIFDGSPWMTGIERVTADIRRRGERSMVITMSPNFFADLLLGMGVDEVRASCFPPLPMSELPDRSAILGPEDKVRLVDDALTGHGWSRWSCIAYGDSASDVPLFRHLPLSVAVNATPQLRRLATTSADGDDLQVAYQAGRRLLDTAAAREAGR